MDYKDIKEVSSDDEMKMKNILRKVKTRAAIRNIGISFSVIILFLIAFNLVSSILLDKTHREISVTISDFNEIANANTYIGVHEKHKGLLDGKDVFWTYKRIGDKIVYTGTKEFNYNIFSMDESFRGQDSPLTFGNTYDVEFLNTKRFNKLGQREMVFFYPFIQYSIYRNDLKDISGIGDDKNIEMALSFDKYYSLDEISNLLPQDINAAWYWVDDLNDKEKDAEKGYKKIEKDQNGKDMEAIRYDGICSADHAYGIKLYGKDGEKLEEPWNNFLNAVDRGKDMKIRRFVDYHKVVAMKSEFKRVHTNICGQDGKLGKEDIKIGGVIVTGSRKQLEKLDGLQFIKASSLGIVTDRY